MSSCDVHCCIAGAVVTHASSSSLQGEYLRYGAGDITKHCVLTQTNLLDRAVVWWKYKRRAPVAKALDEVMVQVRRRACILR